MDDIQCLRDSHPCFVLRQSVQPLQNRLDLALSQQLLREFLYRTMSLA